MLSPVDFVSDIDDALHRLRELRATTLDERQLALVDETIAGLEWARASWQTRLTRDWRSEARSVNSGVPRR